MDAKTVVRILTDVTGFLPGAASIHSLLAAHPDQAALLIPVIENLDEGESALEAAERAAPDLTAAIKNLASSLVTSSLPGPAPGKASAASAAHAESLVRSLGGLGKLTPTQEQAWMDRFTPTGSG